MYGNARGLQRPAAFQEEVWRHRYARWTWVPRSAQCARRRARRGPVARCCWSTTSRCCCARSQRILRADGHRIALAESAEQAEERAGRPRARRRRARPAARAPQRPRAAGAREARAARARGDRDHRATPASRARSAASAAARSTTWRSRSTTCTAFGPPCARRSSGGAWWRRNRELEAELRERVAPHRAGRRARRVMRALGRTIHGLRHNESHVLLRGESGTGKELVARAIHAASPRAARSLRPGRLRRAARVDHRERAVRPREGRVHRRDRRDRALPHGARRHALPRRDRRDPAQRPGEAAARAPGEGGPPGRRRERGRRWTSASSAPRTAISSAWSRRAASARTSSTGSTWSASRFRRCASAATTSRCWSTTSSRKYRGRALAGRRHRGRGAAAAGRGRLAGQRARARERDRVGDGAGARAAHPRRGSAGCPAHGAALGLAGAARPPALAWPATSAWRSSACSPRRAATRPRPRARLGIGRSTLYRKLAKHGLQPRRRR